LVGVLLSACFQESKHFLALQESAFGISGFPTDDQDGAAREVQVLIRHAKDFIGPHALAEHDDGDALECLWRKRQVFKLLFECQDVHVGYFLREWLDLPSWQGKATVRSRRQGRRGMAFTGAKRKPLTEDADGSGAEFGQEGHETGLEQVWMSALRAALGPAK
jgi:hypothetical protein